MLYAKSWSSCAHMNLSKIHYYKIMNKQKPVICDLKSIEKIGSFFPNLYKLYRDIIFVPEYMFVFIIIIITLYYD